LSKYPRGREGLLLCPASKRGGTAFHLINRPLRLVRCIRRVRLEPESIGAEVDLARPFEAASPFADTHLRKDLRIGDGGNDALVQQMIETVDGRLTVRHVTLTL